MNDQPRDMIVIKDLYKHFGSVKALNGVSLTVNGVGTDSFDVMIIPHTQSATIIRHYEVGTAVNIEVAIVERYLERLVAHAQ